MSVAEIKTAIDRMNREELKEVAAHLRRKRWEDSPERRQELSDARDAMERGEKYSLVDLKKLHEDLMAKGQ